MLPLAKRMSYQFVGAIAIAALAGGCNLDTGTQEGLAVLAIISGSRQNLEVGARAQPLVLKAFDFNRAGMRDVQVDWTIAANAGTISASGTVTDDGGETSVNYTAPSTAGDVQILARAEGLTVTFNLLVAPLSGS